MSDYDSVLAAANQLSSEERMRLIDDLWCATPPALSPAWREEIARRSAELDRGEVETIPWETVRDNALRRLEERRED